MIYIYPTVDVETPQKALRRGLITRSLIAPGTAAGDTGAPEIASIFSEVGVKAVFFLATNEKHVFGDAEYKELCAQLVQMGHEVAIHPHPEWQAKDGRISMWQFSLQEQTDILEEMIEDLTDWAGNRPIAHRAGAYGANPDTIAALRHLGIAVDSSLFSGHWNCFLKGPANTPFDMDGVLEIPVTFMLRHDYFLRWRNFRGLKIRSVNMKTDIDSCSHEQLLDYASADFSRPRLMNLFMHSYSIFDYSDLGNITRNRNGDKLRRFLDHCTKREGIRFITSADCLTGEWVGLMKEGFEADVPEVECIISLGNAGSKLLNKFSPGAA